MARFVEKKCARCGNKFSVVYKLRNQSKYCNLECAYADRRKDTSVENATIVTKQCGVCGKDFEIPYKLRKQKFCSHECASVNYAETYKHSETTCRKMSEKRIGKPTWNKGLTANEDSRILAGENSPSYGKVYQTKQTHPEWAAKIKKSTKGKINLGDTNAMTRPDVQAKMSASRKKRLANDPELCQRISAYVKAAWADGKFDGVRVGQCKWFTYVKQDGTSVKLQGTWELAFAKWMDENNVKFVAHRTWVPYKDEQGNVHLYYPDFYVETWGEWVDVKNDYHWGLQKDKFDCIRRSNPSMRIRVILKKELEELGVSL